MSTRGFYRALDAALDTVAKEVLWFGGDRRPSGKSCRSILRGLELASAGVKVGVVSEHHEAATRDFRRAGTVLIALGVTFESNGIDLRLNITGGGSVQFIGIKDEADMRWKLLGRTFETIIVDKD